MTSKSIKPSSVEKNVRIRFRDSDQLELIKKAARQQRLSMNMFVRIMSDRAARVMVEAKPTAMVKFFESALAEEFSDK